MEDSKFKLGDRVKMTVVPPQVEKDESRSPDTFALFQRAVGRDYEVRGFNDYGLIELWLLDGGFEDHRGRRTQFGSRPIICSVPLLSRRLFPIAFHHQFQSLKQVFLCFLQRFPLRNGGRDLLDKAGVTPSFADSNTAVNFMWATNHSRIPSGHRFSFCVEVAPTRLNHRRKLVTRHRGAVPIK